MGTFWGPKNWKRSPWGPGTHLGAVLLWTQTWIVYCQCCPKLKAKGGADHNNGHCSDFEKQLQCHRFEAEFTINIAPLHISTCHPEVEKLSGGALYAVKNRLRINKTFSYVICAEVSWRLVAGYCFEVWVEWAKQKVKVNGDAEYKFINVNCCSCLCFLFCSAVLHIVRFPNPLATGSGLGFQYPKKWEIFLWGLLPQPFGNDQGWEGAYWVRTDLGFPWHQHWISTFHPVLL